MVRTRLGIFVVTKEKHIVINVARSLKLPPAPPRLRTSLPFSDPRTRMAHLGTCLSPFEHSDPKMARNFSFRTSEDERTQSLQYMNRFQPEFCDFSRATTLLQSRFCQASLACFEHACFSKLAALVTTLELSLSCSFRCFSSNPSTVPCRGSSVSCDIRMLTVTSRNTSTRTLSPCFFQNSRKHPWMILKRSRRRPMHSNRCLSFSCIQHLD